VGSGCTSQQGVIRVNAHIVIDNMVGLRCTPYHLLFMYPSSAEIHYCGVKTLLRIGYS